MRFHTNCTASRHFKHWTNLSPAPLIEVGDQVVEAIDHGLVFLLSLFNAVFRVDFSNILAGATEKVLIAIDGIFNFTSLQYRILVGQKVEASGKKITEGIARGIPLERF
jgi:hypothetical protein